MGEVQCCSVNYCDTLAMHVLCAPSQLPRPRHTLLVGAPLRRVRRLQLMLHNCTLVVPEAEVQWFTVWFGTPSETDRLPRDWIVQWRLSSYEASGQVCC
jgi:hypothetical protein